MVTPPRTHEPVRPAQLGDELLTFCVEQLDAIARDALAGLAIPKVWAGHLVGADVRADLLYTLGHLHRAGVTRVAGRDIESLIVEHLGRVDGNATHTFFSYRVAETVALAGPVDDNRWLAQLDQAQRDEVTLATESTSWIALLDDAKLPRNYAAVLTRCEAARAALGFAVDPMVFASLLERLRSFLGSNPLGYLDDSHDASGRYDIYTGDVWLFCEPLASDLGALWEHGMFAALDLVEAVGRRDGSAVPWGRSTGVLSVALMVELAAFVLTDERCVARRSYWLARLTDAIANIRSWYDEGVVNAHHYRNQDAYRGPARRLQLTFDVLGKLAWSGAQLAVNGESTALAAPKDAYPRQDRYFAFEQDRSVGAWAYRGGGLDFVVPFVGAARSHYYPSVHAPGTFEVPVDADLPCWVPFVHRNGARFAGGGAPVAVDHAPRSLRARWESMPATSFDYTGALPEPLVVDRTADWRVDGRSIVVDERVVFESVPDALTVMIPERVGRPLQVTFESPEPHTVSRIPVAGVAEWRSSWSEFEAVHQCDVEPSATVAYSLRVTPQLRVVSTAHGHHYHRSLYEPMGSAVRSWPNPLGPLGDPSVNLADIDLFHLHWPEWIGFDDPATHEEIIATLKAHDVPVVWTAHNLTPHEKRADVYDGIYQLWAHAVDAVIHHSAFGERLMRSRYRFNERCAHHVIAHGHFGALWESVASLDRHAIEQEFELRHGVMRIGLFGAPRREKQVLDFLRAFVASQRRDVEVVCWSLAHGETPPDDDRIAIARPYRMVAEHEYAKRLAVCDVMALPFSVEGEMLATGTVADAIGVGIPALTGDWEYLSETLGDSAIPMGSTAESMTAAIDALDADALSRSRVAMAALRGRYEWDDIANATMEVFESAVARH